MPTLDQYRYPPNPTNFAINDILANLNLASDLDDRKSLVTALRGIDAVMEDAIQGKKPNPDQCPCVRVFGGRYDYPIKTVKLFTLDGFAMVHLYFIIYAPDTVNFAVGTTVESMRDDMVRHCLRFLETPDDGSGLGMNPDIQHYYFPVKEWTLTIDHDTPLKYFGNGITLPYPYFVSRVDLQVEFNNYQVTG